MSRHLSHQLFSQSCVPDPSTVLLYNIEGTDSLCYQLVQLILSELGNVAVVFLKFSLMCLSFLKKKKVTMYKK